MCTGVEPFHFESTRPIKEPRFAQQSEEIKRVPLNGYNYAIRRNTIFRRGLIITIRITARNDLETLAFVAPRLRDS